MSKAKKLPSGSWRCLVYSHSEPAFDKSGKPALDKSGKQKMKRIYESFTSSDPSAAGKREAERAAAEFAYNKTSVSKPKEYTLGEAIDKSLQITILRLCLPFSAQMTEIWRTLFIWLHLVLCTAQKYVL